MIFGCLISNPEMRAGLSVQFCLERKFHLQKLRKQLHLIVNARSRFSCKSWPAGLEVGRGSEGSALRSDPTGNTLHAFHPPGVLTFCWYRLVRPFPRISSSFSRAAFSCSLGSLSTFLDASSTSFSRFRRYFLGTAGAEGALAFCACERWRQSLGHLQ